jgi:hypothetical protein
VIGPDGLAEALAAFINDNMPPNVNRLADELGQVVHDPFAGAELTLDAQPRLVSTTQLPTDAVPLDYWPFVVVVVGRMTGQRRVDVRDGNVIYERDYQTRLWWWARGDGYSYTSAVRGRGLLALGETLLRAQTFGTAEGKARISDVDWREEYSDVGEDPETRDTIAAAYIETTVTCEETLTGTEPLGVANTFEVDTRALDHHPAL